MTFFINWTEPKFRGNEQCILIMQTSSYKNTTDDEQWDLKFQWCAAVSCTQKLNKPERVATINTDNSGVFKWSKQDK